jgi:ATP-binding cassette subfamily B protein
MEALRRAISIIEQDIFLFSRSIEDNIAFGLQGSNGSHPEKLGQGGSSHEDGRTTSTGDDLESGFSQHQAVEQAARAAQADEFIDAMDKGYQTVIGERGVTLSGGQRQRLALARAFLTDPKILVLDDSTSAIDSATEDKIQRAIYAAARGRTTLIITHRLSQIRWADLILVLRQGKLAAMGKHEELMQSSEAYRRIFSE